MPQSLAQIYLHIVFSTKHRMPFLKDREVREAMHAYLAGICKKSGSPALRIGGTEDHVHIACRFSRRHVVADLLRKLKEGSSKWVKGRAAPALADFYWQRGYGAFSVSPGHLPALIDYIANQEEHHRKESFQGEYRRLLKKYDVAYDERYVWD